MTEKTEKSVQKTPYADMTPQQAREWIREKNLEVPHQSTSGFSQGYKQANVAIVPLEFADDFERLCKLNSGPLPLLYRSDPGELSAGALAPDSNIKTDLCAYKTFVNGKLSEILSDIAHIDLSNFVTFYLGCSFSFEKTMLDFSVPVRNLEKGKNVSMYRTNIDLNPSGPFHGRMIVSMRPIPSEKLSLCASLANPLKDVHGCPIHIGDPKKIGIQDISSSDSGDPPDIHEGEVPVFWCCGVTNSEAIISAKLPFCITHYPGCMFIADTPVEEPPKGAESSVTVHKIDPFTSDFSLCSTPVFQKLVRIEEIIASDPGNRGIEHLRIPGDFVSACLALSQANSILITTGFGCAIGAPVPYENDGPTGTLTLAKSLLLLGKKVTILCEDLLNDLLQNITKQWMGHESLKNLRFVNISESYRIRKPHDICLAIERVSPAADGNYYTMKARRLPKDRLTQPAENIFRKTKKLTIGIGDGGNELGMGKVARSVRENIPNGQTIASTIATDLLISAGVSNWGAWGLAFGLYALHHCDVHQRYKNHGLENLIPLRLSYMPKVDSERELLALSEKAGLADGICALPGHVDGMRFDVEHVKILKDLTSVILD